tara:strand:- start:75 stop:698 length:624 start_codon:yes stop_codon:yes gene_type:complete
LLKKLRIIDDFLKDPYQVRRLALSSNFDRDYPAARWPGYRANLPEPFRSQYLQQLNSILDEDLEFCGAYFQCIGKEWGSGLYHVDFEIKWTVLTFLNLNPPSHSGIEIGEVYSDNYINSIFENGQESIDAYGPSLSMFNKSKKTLIQRFFFDREIKKYNSHYKNPCVVSNKFNRTVIFRGHRNHCAQNFFGTRPADSRLTIISFLTE